jgi:hypothetical protein
MASQISKFFSDPVTRVLVLLTVCVWGSSWFLMNRIINRPFSKDVAILEQEYGRARIVIRILPLTQGLSLVAVSLLLMARKGRSSRLQVSLLEILIYTAIVAASLGIVRSIWFWMYPQG